MTKHVYTFLTVICIVFVFRLPAQTLYVSSTTGNDNNNGTTWHSAFKTLSKALQHANNDDATNQVLVASGTYFPAGTNYLSALHKDSSFYIIKGGLKILGGYSLLTHKKDINNPSVLSGNNCYHVLVIAGLNADADSVVIDGFTINGGFANDTSKKMCQGESISSTQGGGIYLSNNKCDSKLCIMDCNFTNNYANKGAGIYSFRSSPTIMNCSFIGNKVNNMGGGAIFSEDGSPQISSCNFQHNGEGMYGGAIYSISDSSTKSTLNIFKCNFIDNVVDQWGAGFYAQGGIVKISNCVFAGNESFANSQNSAGGGGIYFANTTAFITNSVFSGNKVGNAAGAGIFSEKSQLTICNCTFSGNNAKYGGALCTRGNQSFIKICNSILYGNSSAIDKYGNVTIAVNYSIIDSGYNGLANYNSDPLFVNAPSFNDAPFCEYKGGHANYMEHNYHLKIGSLAIDTGNSSFYTITGGNLTDFDLASKQRFFGSAIDMGAYEYQLDNDTPITNFDPLKTK